MTKQYACTDYQEWLVDSLGQPLDDVEHRMCLQRHLAECSTCAEASAELHGSWDMFRELQTLAPPPAVRERSRHAVLALMAEEKLEVARSKWREVSRAPLAVLSGLLVAAATLSLLWLGRSA